MAKMGRPKERNPKDKRIIVLLTEEFKGQVEQVAERHGYALGELARVGLEQQLEVLETIEAGQKQICLTVTQTQHTQFTAAAKRYGFESIEALCLAMLDGSTHAPATLMANLTGHTDHDFIAQSAAERAERRKQREALRAKQQPNDKDNGERNTIKSAA